MKGKLLILWTVSVAVVVLFLGACAGAPSTGGPGKSRAPDWVTGFPADSAYFIGVGSSNTGNQAEDNEIARKNAMTNLAAAISTKIQSETSFREVDEGTGTVSRSAEVQINEVVAQNLQAVETMDSFYAPDWGYWYYVRLNKAKWAEIQAREMRDLETRVLDLVVPVLSGRTSVAERLTVLARGWNIVAESPYTGMIKTNLEGESGSLIDLLEKQIGSYVNSLSVQVTPASVETDAGRPVKLNLSVTSALGIQPGQLTFSINAKDRPDGPSFRVVTDKAGKYSEDVSFSGYPVGKSYLTAILDLSEFGIQPGSVKTEIIVAQRDFLLDIRQQKALLVVRASGDVDSEYSQSAVYNTAKALFSKTLPVKIEEASGDKTYTLTFTLQYRNAPPNDYGFTIIFVKGNLSVMKESKSIFTYETPEAKGGGLNWSQANTKALEKLFGDLELDAAFIQGITGAFSFD